MKWRVWRICKGRQRTLRKKKKKKLMPYKTRATLRLGIEGQRQEREWKGNGTKWSILKPRT